MEHDGVQKLAEPVSLGVGSMRGEQSVSADKAQDLAYQDYGPECRSAAQVATLRESDVLAAELIAADLVVAGVPMYNFGIPSPLKAWIDNVVRVGPTFGFDRTRPGEPYWPMLEPGKRLVILTARGDHGDDEGGPSRGHEPRRGRAHGAAGLSRASRDPYRRGRVR
ncbi:NAD(P)H-dependent oxidoreductase [Methylobacterium sp. WSM2598]|uniref:NAD(P)H-dependent oxidoreductase n=1 Tax=Methylobacterium sp. WSM2598 TaxID=398261 RepID=UPI0018DFFFF1|nr:NAD(P)H-dependent oxidoreductase [Methylobacterium sp. WSM2598]